MFQPEPRKVVTCLIVSSESRRSDARPGCLALHAGVSNVPVYFLAVVAFLPTPLLGLKARSRTGYGRGPTMERVEPNESRPAMTAGTNRQAEAGTLKLYTVEDLDALPDPKWRIEGLIPESGLVELYGQPGVGKSFLVLDWALSIASGVQWLGHRLGEGDVVYVCAEGGRGIKKRIAAWREKHPGADLSRFRVLPQPLDMLDGKDVKALIAAIKDASSDPALVVIDTLARCFGGGDENATRDMNLFVVACDWIRDTFRAATVLVVHHTGKDPRRKDRGNTALRGAADTVMDLAKPGGKAMTLKCDKQKDWEPFEAIGLSLRVVTLKDGESSCAIAASDVLNEPIEPEDQGSDAKALKALQGFGADGATYTEWIRASELSKSTFKCARKRLLQSGSVRHEGKRYWIAGEGQGQGQGH